MPAVVVVECREVPAMSAVRLEGLAAVGTGAATVRTVSRELTGLVAVVAAVAILGSTAATAAPVLSSFVM
jgi:hypothetical protein